MFLRFLVELDMINGICMYVVLLLFHLIIEYLQAFQAIYFHPNYITDCIFVVV